MDFPDIYHSLLGQPCFAKFMAIPNYTYLKLKMPGPKGVITVEGSFKQAYYCEQDYITQAAALSIPYDPNGSDRDTGRTVAKKGTKATVTHDRPSIGEPPEAPSGSDGSTGPSI